MAPNYISHIFLAFLLFSIQAFAFVAQSKDLKFDKKSSFKYLQNLEGVKKGQKMKGVTEVKQYLKKFGYYPAVSTDAKLMSDDFDDLLESALKTYQNNFRLSVTGTLDYDTIKQMMIPRCGMPDINHQTTDSTEQNHRSNKFHTVAHFNFPKEKYVWPRSKYNLAYTFKSAVEVVDVQTLRGVCSRAFQKWTQVSPFTFREAPDGAQSDIVIGFYSGDHGDNCPFSPGSTAIAFGYYPQDGRLHFRGDADWSTQPNSNQNDLESFALHEIGHLLGLDHSNDTNAIMFPTIDRGTLKRNLGQDDINGIQELYRNN